MIIFAPLAQARLSAARAFAKTASIATLALAAAATALSPAAAQNAENLKARQTLESYDAETVVATVGGQDVTLGDLIAARQALPPQLLQMDRQIFFVELLDRLTAQQLLSQAAEKQKLQDEEDVAAQLANTRRAFLIEQLVRRVEADPALGDKLIAEAGLNDDAAIARQLNALRRGLLSQAYITRVVDQKMNDESLKALYDEVLADERMKAQLAEVRARHILLETQEDADAVLKSLQGGASFEELAKERSKDNSGRNGGDLGYFRRGQMVPAFDQAAFALEKPGDLSAVVQSQFGFHIIKLEDRRTLSFDQVKDFLRQMNVERLGEEEISRLKEEIGYSVAEKLPPADAIAEDDLLK